MANVFAILLGRPEGIPTIRFCEANIAGILAQPSNAISSLAISLIGLYLAVTKRGISRYLGLAVILVGLASFSYHASFTFLSQLLDLGSMFLLAAMLIWAALRRFKLPVWAQIVIVLGAAWGPLFLVATYRTIWHFNLGIPFFAILLVTAIGLELATAKQENRSMALYWWALGVFLIGFGVWGLDYSHIWCNPLSFHIINGHAVWHFGCAAAVLILADYYPKKGAI